MAIEAVLFDIDGTLVDSNDFHVQAWAEAFHDAGYTFDAQTIHDQIGKGTDNLVPTLLPDSDEDEQERLGEAHGAIFKRDFLHRVKAFPGARDLLKRAHETGQRVVLASSASQGELEHYLDLLDAHDLVDETTTSDDVERTKPAPDIFTTALEKIGRPDPANVMVVGDTPYDVDAADRCGMSAIGLRSGNFSDASLNEAGAVMLYDDAAALLADYGNSPLGK